MQADIDNLRSLRANGFSAEPIHDEAPKVNFMKHVNSWQGVAIGIALTIVTFFIFWAIFSFKYEDDHKVLVAAGALNYGLSVGIWAAVIYYAYPLFVVLFKMIKHKQWPSKIILGQYSKAQIYVSCIVFSLIACFLLNSVMGIVINLLHGHFVVNSRYIPSWWRYAVISVGVGVALGFALPRLLPNETQPKARKKEKVTSEVTEPNNIPFGLWVGRSTGYLAKLWHRTGLAEGKDISLSLEDAAQNILVLGGIGSGKTTRLMQPLLTQLLEQECGGIIFDVKGDVTNAVLSIAEHCNVDVAVIGTGENTWAINVLGGLSPEMAASFFKSIFLLSGGTRTEGFWIDTATELCRNTLGVLSFIEGHYTLHSLYNYLFDEEFRGDIQEQVNTLLVCLEEKEQRLLKSYVRYHDNVFVTFDDKVKSGVTATIAQVLSPFNHPDLIDAFCQEDSTMDMTALFDRWIFLVDMPLAQWGLGAKVIYTLIKLRFFNIMQNRIHNPEWNQTNPVFFMCDEYQELISASKDGLSDLNFWDKSRSSKTIGIISSQSVSSFYATIGDHDLANAILQNFRQKFCFRTEDRATLSLMNDLAGQARVQKMTISQGSSIAHDGKQSLSQNESVTEAREAVLDAPLFRQLEENQVIGLLSVNGRSMDDLFWVVPVYVSH